MMNIILYEHTSSLLGYYLFCGFVVLCSLSLSLSLSLCVCVSFFVVVVDIVLFWLDCLPV